MTYLERAITDGHAKLTGEGKQQKILYVAVNHTERYADPEEQVRAEFWAELIYRYGYEPARIGVEITVPDRTPSAQRDFSLSASTGERAGVRCRSLQLDERKKPYAVIECEADGVTDAEFNQAVEQACGNGTWAKFRANYVGVVAGMTRRFFDFSGKFGDWSARRTSSPICRANTASRRNTVSARATTAFLGNYRCWTNRKQDSDWVLKKTV
jgi:type I restriction enzyme M protein